MDITYIKGVYLLHGVCIGYSRKAVRVRISNTLSSEFCVEALRKIVEKHEIPEISHTDIGKQLFIKEFTELLREKKIELSVSEIGFKENQLIEKFWSTYKYEFVYL